MNADDVSLLFDHLYLARDRILAAASAAPAALHDPGHPTERGLHATLVHELDVEWSWRQLLTSPDPTAFDDSATLTTADLPDLDTLVGRWRVDEAQMRTWIHDLGDDGLAGPCRARDPIDHPMWFHLVHIYSHGINQLSDAAILLSMAGQSPGDLSFLDLVDPGAAVGG
jgi:uncharacterized damage-inducible protein DinB